MTDRRSSPGTSCPAGTPRNAGVLSAALIAIALAACNGGDSGEGSAGGHSDAIASAVKNGDPTALTDADEPTLLKRAIEIATEQRQWQQAALENIYHGPTTLALNHGTNSGSIGIATSRIATPFIVADNGSGMAAIARIGSGRAMAYGADVLAWMADGNREQQHQPLFGRAFAWLLSGNADAKLPAAFKVGVAGYDANKVLQYAQRAGSKATQIDCKVDDPDNTCWSGADLIVFGAGTADSPRLSARVRSYVEAGKAVIYMHPYWPDSAGGRKVLSGLGMTLGGYPGNYFASPDGVSVGAARTGADSVARADKFGVLLKTLQLMERKDLSGDFSDRTPLDPINAVHNELASLQTSGVDIFTEPDSDLYRVLVLWADVHRRGMFYDKLSQHDDADDFLRAYASDSWLVFNRAHTTVPPGGAGGYMPASAARIQAGNGWEELEVTIPQGGGVTLIGRGAIPGKPVSLQVVDRAGARDLGVQTSFLRAVGNPFGQKYGSPRRPHSFTIPLAANGDTVFVSPFGGPLMLNYGGANAGTVVKLKIKGATKYAHFDFTRKYSQSEFDEAVAAMMRDDFGWQTDKMIGGEIQQTIGNARNAMDKLDPKTYVERIRSIVFESNHLANGYNNMPMSALARSVCNESGWDCEGALHRAPGVQHFVGWIPQCGDLCSGNPVDSWWGMGTGWGEAHELGHNTVQRVMHIAPNGHGCVVECDNNILASATMLRKFALLGVDEGHATNHPGLYAYIVANRGTGLGGEALRADMENRLWGGAGGGGQDPMRAVHFQLGFQYARLRAGLAKPGMETTLEFFQLLTKADRLVGGAWDAGNKGKYGMGRFADNRISNEDLLYVLSSKIIGRDMRRHFAMYGIPLTPAALGSVADLGLAEAPLSFYALAEGKHNQLAGGAWMDIEGRTPAYPF